MIIDALQVGAVIRKYDERIGIFMSIVMNPVESYVWYRTSPYS